jgi:adenine phosphoribosyltransferase
VVSNDQLGAALRAAFAWRGDLPGADASGWWADPAILAAIGPALAALHAQQEPTLVAGIEAHGFLLGPLVAVALDIGFVAVEKNLVAADVGDDVTLRTTPPDYNERDLTLGVRTRRIGGRDRVLLADEWIQTGAHATATRRIIEDLGAAYVGAAVIVDATTNDVRRSLNVRSLLRVHDLG